MTLDLEKLYSGDRRTLSKAITLVESTSSSHRAEARELIEKCISRSGNSIRIGITGIPGVGKSTFINNLAHTIAESGAKVAILAVDPSSPVSGGSILGDKTRMSKVANHENVYVRPSPSSGSLGGVAHKTREAMILCEAAGYEIILVETVGVGQSEYEVADMVDQFLLLLLPSTGDELQGIKKGIVEIANAIVINKADGDLEKTAHITKQEYNNALSLLDKNSDRQVFTCSAINNKGIDEVWSWVTDRHTDSLASGEHEKKREEQNMSWTRRLVFDLVMEKLHSDRNIQKKYEDLESKVKRGETSPLQAAQKILKLI